MSMLHQISSAKGSSLHLQAKRAKLAPAEPELKSKPEERPGAAARSLRQAFLVERLLCEADAAEVCKISGYYAQSAPNTDLAHEDRSSDMIGVCGGLDNKTSNSDCLQMLAGRHVWCADDPGQHANMP